MVFCAEDIETMEDSLWKRVEEDYSINDIRCYIHPCFIISIDEDPNHDFETFNDI